MFCLETAFVSKYERNKNVNLQQLMRMTLSSFLRKPVTYRVTFAQMLLQMEELLYVLIYFLDLFKISYNKRVFLSKPRLLDSN